MTYAQARRIDVAIHLGRYPLQAWEQQCRMLGTPDAEGVLRWYRRHR